MKTQNSLFIIRPYRDLGTWLFDDESKNIEREPFVMGIPEMIDAHLLKKGIKGNQFTLIFSTTDIPNADAELIKDKDLSEGTWYKLKGTDQNGWLCPALTKYFDKTPDKLSILLKA